MPICERRALHVLRTTGTLFTAVFVWIRLLDGSYAAGGAYQGLIAESARPHFAAASAARPLLNPSIFVLVSMLATAFLAHYNAPKCVFPHAYRRRPCCMQGAPRQKRLCCVLCAMCYAPPTLTACIDIHRYFKELATPADGSSKQAAFNKVCIGAFGLAAVLCGSIMAGGYLTFGGAAKGLILNSYAIADLLSLLPCYPLAFSPLPPALPLGAHHPSHSAGTPPPTPWRLLHGWGSAPRSSSLIRSTLLGCVTGKPGWPGWNLRGPQHPSAALRLRPCELQRGVPIASGRVLGMVGLRERAGEPAVHVTTTLLLMVVMNGLALVLKDLGLVVAFGGAHARAA